MRRPRIILDLLGLDLLWAGAGLFRYAVDLVHALRELDPPARFTVLGAKPEPIPELRPVFHGTDGWRYRAFPRSVGWAGEYRNHVRMAHTLFTLRADLYHGLHTFLPLLAPCRSLVTVHDLMFELFPEYQGAVRSRPYRIFRWAVRHRARRIICSSQTTADDLARLWGVDPARLHVVYLGSQGFQAPADPVPAGFANPILRSLGDGPVLCSPFNLEPRKNLGALLEAFARLTPALSPACRLVLFGKAAWTEDRARQFTAELARLGLTKRVVLPGVLSDADLAHLYRRCTVFVFPSLYEGFGYPVLEAMAAGACVVARHASSMAEVVGTAGVLVETADPEQLTAALQKLMADAPERNRLGRMAAERARQFTVRRMAEQTWRAYQTALGRPTRELSRATL
jgi:glycosyltransferase involved in cell wall biosynthesis